MLEPGPPMLREKEGVNSARDWGPDRVEGVFLQF